MRRLGAALGVGLALTAAAAQAAPRPAAKSAPAPTARIDWVSVRLLYETTGALSVDLMGPEGFGGWNTVIGEGGAKEPARDLLVQVFLSTPSGTDSAGVREPLTVVVTGDRSGRLASRSFKAPHLFRDGKAVRSVYVPNATCAGRVTVSARVGGERRDVVATLRCGE